MAATLGAAGVVANRPALAEVALPALPALPTVGERIVLHDQAGMALDGFDPVGYFALGRAVAGSSRHELQWRGVTWRFASAANLEAFRQAPEVYAPLFGGHDPLGLADGRAVEGDPQIHALVEGRLALFRTPRTREAFLARAGGVQAAQAAWPAIEAQLAR
jgi:YHS domain-containing protein